MKGMNGYRTSAQERAARASREAAEWLNVMWADAGTAEREAFAEWIRSSPLHVRELLMAEMLDRELSASGVLDGFDVDAIVARAKANNNVLALGEATTRVPRRLGRVVRPAGRKRISTLARVAIAAGMAVLGVTGVWLGFLSNSGVVQYTSSLGEQRVVTLPDDTIVTLAPRSHISVDYSTLRREVTLGSGEARFQVVHNARRPFFVHVGSTVVEDIGTVFIVNRLPSGAVVKVIQGKVRVMTGQQPVMDDGSVTSVKFRTSRGAAVVRDRGNAVIPYDISQSLVAGQSAHISSDGRELILHKGSQHAGGDARTAQVFFYDVTLADIAAEFNRYNKTQITVVGQEARAQRYSGVFATDGAESFLQFLTCCSRLRVLHRGNDVIVSLAKGTSAD
jgi:transmembrane sensor